MQDAKSSNTQFTLFAVLLAVFVVPSSISGTAIALPYISTDIQSDLASLQWVVNAFNLTFACFTLIWGKISDVWGKKRSFFIGAFIYTLASTGSALSTNALMLDIFRALAGVGGAAIFACGSAIFIHAFEGDARTKAFALFGTTAGLGITLGPTISGILLDSIGWQAIFFMHAVALFLVLIVSVKIPADQTQGGSFAQIDLIGSFFFISSMFLLMIALSKGYDWGWKSQSIILSFAGSAACFLGFILRIRAAKFPVLSLDLIKNHRFLGLILVPVVASFTFVTLLTYFPTFLTGSMQLSASKAGVIMLFLTAPVLVFPLIAGKLSAKGVSTNLLMYLSIISMLIGAAGLVFVVENHISVMAIACALILIGIGMGMSAGLVDGQALSSVKESDVGMAAGLLNTFRLGSEAIGVAIYGSLLSSIVSNMVPIQLKEHIVLDTDNWVNAISSGNFMSMLVQGQAEQAGIFETMSSIYNSAFVTTNIALTGMALIVSSLVIFYLRKEKYSVQGEAQVRT
ncbi:MFS transporter [Marinomonas sp. MED121]|uniref:MFS transporter n=1 Tax=Marinomonas sp. MED121 TaxID=314277 RepID=UPI00031D7BC8|nr:MFS transporter [Marinomonas sp. MED121]